MIERVGKACCGCAACMCICPNDCIKMVKNHEGFIYPQVDNNRCVKCGICTNVCPVLNTPHNTISSKEAWACISYDAELLQNSSSGGVFTLLAEIILQHGGIVIGASFSDDYYSVKHIAVNDLSSMRKLQGSKYLQSDTDTIFKDIKKYLLSGKEVLFSGTPCQIAGLKSFLGKDYVSLYCVDVICHGVPSPDLWRRYLETLEHDNSGKAVYVNFRHKEGDAKHKISCAAKNYYKNMHQEPYMKLFLKDIALRESCYHCVVKEKGTSADITIGDFWGIEKLLPDIDPSNGVSLVLANTVKGKELFYKISQKMKMEQVSYDLALQSNRSYSHSSKRPMERDDFYAFFETHDCKTLIKKYLSESAVTKLRRILAETYLGKLRRALRQKIKGIQEPISNANRFQYGLMIQFSNHRSK